MCGVSSPEHEHSKLISTSAWYWVFFSDTSTRCRHTAALHIDSSICKQAAKSILRLLWACDDWSWAFHCNPSQTCLGYSLVRQRRFTAIFHHSVFPKAIFPWVLHRQREGNRVKGNTQGLCSDAKWVWMWPFDMWCLSPSGAERPRKYILI